MPSITVAVPKKPPKNWTWAKNKKNRLKIRPLHGDSRRFSPKQRRNPQFFRKYVPCPGDSPAPPPESQRPRAFSRQQLDCFEPDSRGGAGEIRGCRRFKGKKNRFSLHFLRKIKRIPQERPNFKAVFFVLLPPILRALFAAFSDGVFSKTWSASAFGRLLPGLAKNTISFLCEKRGIRVGIPLRWLWRARGQPRARQSQPEVATDSQSSPELARALPKLCQSPARGAAAMELPVSHHPLLKRFSLSAEL